MKEQYLNSCISQIRKILTLQDRNEFSKTYGCFDRNYWHYKTRDFPSGMSQEFTLALALVYITKFPKNIFYKNKNIFKWVLAGIENTITQSRPDGSLDDYYPYERALGASVFTTYALSQACIILGIENKKYNKYFFKSTSWMSKASESGLLTNHHAIEAMCYLNVYRLTKLEKYATIADKKIKQIISFQDKEGWFPEYGGCSPGYLTVTIDFLAQYYIYRPCKSLKESLLKAIDFFYDTQHPDGTCGGDYDSRNTSFFHPNGFEILSSLSDKSLKIVNSYLIARQRQIFPVQEDDYTMGHSLISNLNAFSNCKRRDFSRLNIKDKNISKTFFSSGIRVFGKEDIWSIFNYKKGGVCRIYNKNNLVYNYSGIIIKTNNKVYINNILQPNTTCEVDKNQIVIDSHFTSFNQKVPSLYNYFLFRSFLISFGKIEVISRMIRKFLQKFLIYKKPTKEYFSKTNIIIKENFLKLNIKITGDFLGDEKVFMAQKFVPIYTAMSEYFIIEELNSKTKKLNKKDNKFCFEIKFKI